MFVYGLSDCGFESSFLWVFDNPLSKYLICETTFLNEMAVFGYLPKLKRRLGLAFGAHFLHAFFHKNVPVSILYQLTKF